MGEGDAAGEMVIGECQVPRVAGIPCIVPYNRTIPYDEGMGSSSPALHLRMVSGFASCSKDAHASITWLAAQSSGLQAAFI